MGSTETFVQNISPTKPRHELNAACLQPELQTTLERAADIILSAYNRDHNNLANESAITPYKRKAAEAMLQEPTIGERILHLADVQLQNVTALNEAYGLSVFAIANLLSLSPVEVRKMLQQSRDSSKNSSNEPCKAGAPLSVLSKTNTGSSLSRSMTTSRHGLSQQSPDLLYTKEVAEIFKVANRTVTKWATSGKIKCVRTIGGQYRFDRQYIASLLEK